MKDIFIIRNYKAKDGSEKSEWTKCGVGFPNRDESINLQLYMFPNVQFQLREHTVREKRNEDKPPAMPQVEQEAPQVTGEETLPF